MLGYPAKALLERRLESLFSPTQWRRLSELSRDILAGKPNRAQISLACRHRQGKAVRGLLNLSVAIDKAGDARYLIVQIQDISRLMRTETELEENRQRYRALSDATFEAVFISREGICIDANHSASVVFGRPREELIGIFGTDVIAPDYQSRVRDNMLSGCEAPYHAVAVKKDGTRFHVMIQGKMIRIGGRDVRVTVVRDIDAQVKAEAALRESERDLRSLR